MSLLVTFVGMWAAGAAVAPILGDIQDTKDASRRKRLREAGPVIWPNLRTRMRNAQALRAMPLPSNSTEWLERKEELYLADLKLLTCYLDWYSQAYVLDEKPPLQLPWHPTTPRESFEATRVYRRLKKAGILEEVLEPMRQEAVK